MKYVEIAQGTPYNRGMLVPKNELFQYIDLNSTLYRSAYTYNEEAVEFAKKNGHTLKNYYGERSIYKVLIDIDKQDNTDEHTLNLARSIIFDLEELGCTHKSIQPYFSGSGYHIVLSNDCFEFPTSSDLPYIVKNTMKKLFPHADYMVYIRTALYRVQHTLNQKTNLYKIPLTIKEIMNEKSETILEMAKKPRIEFPYQSLLGEGELSEYVQTNVPKIDALNKVREPLTIVPCVQQMLMQGPQDGCRNTTAMRIVSHLRRNGVPSYYAKAVLTEWNKNQLNKEVLNGIVERVYNAGYQYGCKDEIMEKHCKTKCIHFQRKYYMIETASVETLQAKLKERLTTDFSGRTINLSKALGLNHIDCDIYPGELITVFGRTGSNKSTFVQNLALGVDFATNSINPEWQVPTLFLSLELADWYMHRRGLQIVSGLNKEQVNDNFEDVFERHKDDLAHITFQTISPTIDQIQQKIKELQPSLVIVDYIDLIDTRGNGRSEHEKIKYISHSLSNIAVNMDVIIIQVSQVGREHSKSDELSLYSAKGSGAIENASRKVISVDGQADNPKKKIKMLKNTDGDSNWECDVEWTESFRLRRTYE